MGSYCVPVLFKFPIQPQFLRKIRFKQAFINTEKVAMDDRERGACLDGCREPQKAALYLWSPPDCNGD